MQYTHTHTHLLPNHWLLLPTNGEQPGGNINLLMTGEIHVYRHSQQMRWTIIYHHRGRRRFPSTLIVSIDCFEALYALDQPIPSVF